MDRPLWQILLAIFAVAFVIHRIAAAAVVYLSDGPPALLAGFALQVAAGIAVALGLWLGRRWVVAAVVLLGIAVAATALLAAFSLQVVPPVMAISQTLVAAVAVGIAALVLRHEFGPRGDGHTPSRDRDRDRVRV